MHYNGHAFPSFIVIVVVTDAFGLNLKAILLNWEKLKGFLVKKKKVLQILWLWCAYALGDFPETFVSDVRLFFASLMWDYLQRLSYQAHLIVSNSCSCLRMRIYRKIRRLQQRLFMWSALETSVLLLALRPWWLFLKVLNMCQCKHKILPKLHWKCKMQSDQEKKNVNQQIFKKDD